MADLPTRIGMIGHNMGGDDVASLGVSWVVRMEINAMRLRRVWIGLDGSSKSETRRVKAKGQAAAACKQIQDTRLATGSEARHLHADAGWHHGFRAF